MTSPSLSGVWGSSGTSVFGSLLENKHMTAKRTINKSAKPPTIQTAKYGSNENHIIVQIPVKDYGNMSDDEKRIQNAEDIARAKATIGKVVQIEFREQKTSVTEEDKKARQTLAENALTELKTSPFSTV